MLVSTGLNLLLGYSKKRQVRFKSPWRRVLQQVIGMDLLKDKAIEYGAGTVIFREGDPPTFAFVVLEGEVEISTMDGENITILTIVHPHQMFGELALLENTRRSCTATTITGCRLLSIDQAALHRKLDSLDSFTRYWFLYLSDRVRDLTKRVKHPPAVDWDRL